ncbi:ATP-binding protein [Cohnella yongneupensis]|uniref:histidine kinase n=1 Tax=Cohnella yongneupensis TaxID=425006 RepID=A0ABW0QXD5_9BACL
MGDPARLAKLDLDNPEQSKRAWYMSRFANRFLALEGSGILVLDSEFRIVEISDMLCAMFDCLREEVISLGLEEWLDRLRIEPPPFTKTQLLGNAFRDRSWTWKSKDKRYAMMLDGEVLEDEGRQIGAFVIFRDVSNLIALEEQIRQSDRLKTIGQIAAGTAHEIRNPLTAMKGFMQLLNKTLSERGMGREQEYISIVLSEIERVNELVGEFLLLSKPREAKRMLVKASTVIQEILPMIRNEALLHNVIVKHYPRSDLLPIVADKELLKQVFLNLGKNAIEAMHGGGTLTIRECCYPDQPDKLAVEIQDTGAGIPADVVEKVFEPFYTTKQQGTGLGLSVCQRIVHDLGGRIVFATDEGGTTFTVWLPYS